MGLLNLERLRVLKRLLDEAFRVPGTRITFGWDPIVGLVPWAGDAVTALLACSLIVQAHRMRVPRVVQLRMIFNVVVDLVVGAIPLFGDAVDFVWKANTKNFALLERHAAGPRPATAGDWLFVGGALAIIGLAALVPLVVMYLIVEAVGPVLPPGPSWKW